MQKRNLTKKQISLLRKVKAKIAEVPERLVMRLVYAQGLIPGEPVGEQTGMLVSDIWNAGNPYEKEDLVPECGSVGCIKGWAEHIDPDIEIDLDWLCQAGSWPKSLAKKYHTAKTAKMRAKLAGEAIDYFIEHDGQKKVGD